jgi:hypothetical protein
MCRLATLAIQDNLKGVDMSPATLELLKDELSKPELDEYTVVVLARRDLARDDIVSAISRLRVDCDKFVTVAPLLQKLVTNWQEERAAQGAQWTQPPKALSSGERLFTL